MRKLFKCMNCSQFFNEEEAKEVEYCCPDCGTLLTKIRGEKAPEVDVNNFLDVQSDSQIGYGVWTVYRTQSGHYVCNCPAFLKYNRCKHVRAVSS